MRSGARWSLRVAVATVVAAAGVVPAYAAHAAVGATVGSYLSPLYNQIVYQAADGQQNQPTVTQVGDEIVFDDTVPLQLSANSSSHCRSVPGNSLQIRCSTSFIDAVKINLGDRHDQARVTSFPVTLGLEVTGGDGNDTIIGPALGEDGAAFTIYRGGLGDDTLLGGGRSERMLDVGGADYFGGGAGTDTVSYQDSPEPVTADADSVSGDDGAATEGDTIAGDVEEIGGSRYSDTLTAVGQSSALWGMDGVDLITGGPGNDKLYGGDGDDTIRGNAGADDLRGGGADRVYGGPDGDLIYGEDGDDYLDGRDGNDTIHGGWGRNVLLGQHGDDILYGGTDALNDLLGGVGYDRCHAGAGGARYSNCEVAD
jgi:Ca2+-binding RTX toxin-like protein